jgi:Flp pilus assembly protein CpaB
MSVKVDNMTGVSGFITPNSRVDVLVSGNPADSGSGERAR